MASFTHPLVAYAEPARAGASTARTLLGLALTALVVWALVEVARFGMAATLFGDVPDGPPRIPGDARNPSTPVGALMILGVFLAVWPALWVVLPLVHRRRGASLFGPNGRIDWRHFRYGLAVSLAVGVIAWAPLVAEHGDGFLTAQPLKVWAMFAAVALPLVFVQCAAEELLFRGYLLQQFAARSFNVLGWSVLPSLLFGMAHPAEGAAWGISWYHFVFGLIMAAVTSRSANLGGAIGLHFGNNLVNLLLIAPAAQVSGLALLRAPEAVDVSSAKATYLVVMFVGAALFMGWMDLSFIRRWRAMKQAEKDAREAERARRKARGASAARVAAE